MGNNVDVRSMLLELGVPRYLTDMAIPMTWFLPGTTDPDEPATIEIVKALQRGLRRFGYKDVQVTGLVDTQTAHALDEVSGPGWVQRTWIQLMSDVINAKRNPSHKALVMRMDKGAAKRGLSGYFEYEGKPPGPLPGYMVGLPPGPLGLGATAVDAGVTLNYGKGVTDPNNMVPIDAVTKSAFKNLQRQLNRNLAPLGRRVAEEGVIGSETRSGILALPGALPKSYWAQSTEVMAKNAVTLGDLLKSQADSLGVTSVANKGSTSSSKSAEKTVVVNPDGTSQYVGAGGGFSEQIKGMMPWVLLAGGVAATAVYMRKNRKRKRKS